VKSNSNIHREAHVTKPPQHLDNRLSSIAEICQLADSKVNVTVKLTVPGPTTHEAVMRTAPSHITRLASLLRKCQTQAVCIQLSFMVSITCAVRERHQLLASQNFQYELAHVQDDLPALSNPRKLSLSGGADLFAVRFVSDHLTASIKTSGFFLSGAAGLFAATSLAVDFAGGRLVGTGMVDDGATPPPLIFPYPQQLPSEE
jgi:hypothetical protein